MGNESERGILRRTKVGKRLAMSKKANRIVGIKDEPMGKVGMER